MNPGTRLVIELAAAAVAAAVGAWAWARLERWKRKTPAELERLRRFDVNRRGRITTARIVDLIESKDPSSRLVLYRYEIGGVRYEAAQDLSALSHVVTAAQCLAGQNASVKYDPKKPTSSIIACEEWCGVPKKKPGSDARRPGIRADAAERGIVKDA